jgi:hypothetical protein
MAEEDIQWQDGAAVTAVSPLITCFRHPEVAAKRPSKDDGPNASAGILRGSLCSHLRMTDNVS